MAKRPRSNTPNAALALLNDPTFVEAALALATRIIKEKTGTLEERIQFAWLTVLSRKAKADEVALLVGLFKESREKNTPTNPSGPKNFSTWAWPRRMLPLILRNWLLGPWYRAILNLGETTIRN